jgi:hypothetical protein
MATTTPNYGWSVPTSTDLVKDGATAIETLGDSADATVKALNPETTLGDIAYRSATANVNTRLGIGSTGQVLTVAAGVPSWATPASGGGITLITSTDMAGVASVTFSSIVGTYKNLVVIIKNFYIGTDFRLRVELNSDTTASNYDNIINQGRSSGAFTSYANSNTLQELTQEGTDSDAFMYLFFPDYTNTIARKQIQNNAGFLSDNGGVVVQNGTHQWRNTNAITDIKILNTLASNFTAGTCQLYGVN